ncbi:HNH endonuclease [Ramlibacter sp. H39-3-26]|uniref:HNH endonuclease n=1 Tax=Curvibacter soli TaxID=3031331 RepID=UPI0023D9C334|nr:HNH endonuclease [Ramlibacter sp. H39-3-26]MDF1486556.1 HNH endonuclease [Ramlibacter sp. H39-3-26]
MLNLSTAEYFLEQLESDGAEALSTGLSAMQLAPEAKKRTKELIDKFRQRLSEMQGAVQTPFAGRYTDSSGEALPMRMCLFFDRLENLGFYVTRTPLARPGTVGRTFRIYHSSIHVAQWAPGMLLRNDPRVMLYRFQKEGLKTIAEAPPDIDVDKFVEQHDIDVRQIYLNPSEGKHYLHVRDESTAVSMLEQWREKIDHIAAPALRGTAGEIAEDITHIWADKTLTPTERKALVDARLGQGRFRTDLMGEFARACAVSKLDVPEALRASHIVPWRSSSNCERTDPKNGLLLSANLDALFDRYLITFDGSGRLIASAALSELQRASLGLTGDFVLPLCSDRQAFMRRHEREFKRRLAAASA